MRPPQPLDDGHLLLNFTCGVPQLDTWLVQQAQRAQRSGTARTWVWSTLDDRVVHAYYSIAPTQIRREDVTRGLAGGVSLVPAYLIARLALDTSLHGRGLGSVLLADALETILDASASAGGRLVVVDAIDDDAARFYERHDFQRIGNTRRLAMKVTTARQALDVRGP